MTDQIDPSTWDSYMDRLQGERDAIAAAHPSILNAQYESRWFECCCGQEFWTPDQTLGPEFVPGDDCPMCATRPLREVLYALQAGSSASAFDEDEDSTVDRAVWTLGDYTVTIERR